MDVFQSDVLPPVPGKEAPAVALELWLFIDAGEPERLVELYPQLAHERERSAEIYHVPLDLASLAETADRLIDHCVEDAGADVLHAGALIDQRLYVRFREDPATRGYGVYLLAVFGQNVHIVCGDAEKSRHLIDERPGPSGAGAVHAHLETAGAGEKEYLRVLAAELNDAVCARKQRVNSGARGVYLLDEGDADVL